jgi:hypothetical protein
MISLIGFAVNLLFILRPYRLMPFLPNEKLDNSLKITSLLNILAIFMCLKFGWNGTGGMIFAIIWEFINGTRGAFYLIIFSMIIAGTLTM